MRWERGRNARATSFFKKLYNSRKFIKHKRPAETQDEYGLYRSIKRVQKARVVEGSAPPLRMDPS
jgi:hypothetical protein